VAVVERLGIVTGVLGLCAQWPCARTVRALPPAKFPQVEPVRLSLMQGRWAVRERHPEPARSTAHARLWWRIV